MKPRHPSTQDSSAGKTSYQTRDRRAVSRSVREEPGRKSSRSLGHDRATDESSGMSKAGWKDRLLRTKKGIDEDNLSIVAAGVAFYVFLGLIPALGALISIWGLVADPAAIRQQIDSMAGMLPSQVIDILDEQMTRIANEKSGALLGTIIGIMLSIWSGAKAMKSLMSALNITYHEEETRGFLRLNFAAIALTVAGIVGFIVAIGIIVALPPALEYVGLGSTAAALVKAIRWPLLALFVVLGLGILYRYGPDHHRAPRQWISSGAVVATLMWLMVSAGFSFYVANFGSYNKTYGTLGAVVVFLLWFLISAYTVLFGAELNAELERESGSTAQILTPSAGGRQAHSR